MVHLKDQRFPIESLRSMELVVPDIGVAETFYTDVWGLDLADRNDGQVFLKAAGDDPYVLALTQGDQPAVLSATYRAAPFAELSELRDRMLANGASGAGELGAVDLWGGGLGFVLRDPVGRHIRIVKDDERSQQTVGGNKSVPLRLAHVNINTDNLARDTRFLVDGLGFEVTDESKMMGFLRTGADHHAVVLARAEVNTLNHIAFLHEGWEDVMKASGRMVDAGYPIGWGPGRHGPGDNVFAYFVDPSGLVIEHTAEVLQVDHSYRVGAPEDWVWPKGRTDHWGIAPAKSEACKRAQLATPFT